MGIKYEMGKGLVERFCELCKRTIGCGPPIYIPTHESEPDYDHTVHMYCAADAGWIEWAQYDKVQIEREKRRAEAALRRQLVHIEDEDLPDGD